MNKILNRNKLPVLLVCILIFVIVLMLFVGNGHKDNDAVTYTQATVTPAVTENITEADVAGIDKEDGQKEQTVPTISILKPAADCSYKLSNDYLNKEIHIKFDKSDTDGYGAEFVTASGNGTAGFIKGIEINEDKIIDVSIRLSHVYEYDVSEDDTRIYLKMYRPRELYDKIIVIDAGHGGKDEGCKSPDRRYYEKNVTLAIIKKLKERLDDSGIKVYYTRLKDETVYLSPRVKLVNDLEADMFVSIHCNAYEYYRAAAARGAETLYSSKVKGLKKANHKLAKLMLEEYVKATGMPAREVIDRKNDIVILKESKVPSAVLEIGYMTDSKDLEYMTDKKKQKKIVDGIYNAIIKYYDINE